MTIKRVACPPLVGRKEAARILGVKPENIYRIDGVPTPLQGRKIKGFEVTTGPLWPRAEIEALAERVRLLKRERAREEQRRKAKRVREQTALARQMQRASGR